MTGPIDEAYVEIHPDVDDFARETNRELTRSFNSIERKLDNVVDAIEDSFDKLIVELKGLFIDLANDVDRSFERVSDDAQSAGRTIDRSISLGAQGAKRSIDDLADESRGDFNRIERQARDAGRGISGAFSSGLGAIAAGGIAGLSAIGGTLRNIAEVPASIGGVIASILKIAAIAAAVPAVIALTGALIDLSAILLTLPAAGAIAVAAIAPIPIALIGMSDAISALVSGDVEKLNEALKKLSPSARSFVKEVKGLLAPLRSLKSSVQEAFFAPLRGVLTELGARLLPVVANGLTKVASVLGTLAASFGRLLTESDILDDINKIFVSTVRFLNLIGPAVINAFGTMFGVIEAGLPFIERFAGWLANVLLKFREFTSSNMPTGEWASWIEDGITTLKELGLLTKSVFNLIMSLAGDAGDEGRSFIATLTEMTNRLANFFNSPQGKEFLQNLFEGLELAGKGLLFFAHSVADSAKAINKTIEFFHVVKIAISEFFQTIKNAGTATKDFFVGIGNAIASGFNSIVMFISQVPGKVTAFLATLPEIFRVGALKAFDALFFAIGFGIGITIRTLQALPGQIAAIFTSLWNGAIARTRQGISEIGTFFASLPGIVASSARRAWELATSIFNSGVTSAESSARSLPGRIFNALKGLASTIRSAFSDGLRVTKDIGVSMINGMISGIESAVGRLVSAAKRAVQSALDGAKKALGIASPSKEWAKLGVQSVQGYTLGVDKSINVSAQDIASAIQLPASMFARQTTNTTNNSNHSESASAPNFTVVVQLGDEQITNPVIRIIENNPQSVALAAESGNTRLSRRR